MTSGRLGAPVCASNKGGLGYDVGLDAYAPNQSDRSRAESGAIVRDFVRSKDEL